LPRFDLETPWGVNRICADIGDTGQQKSGCWGFGGDLVGSFKLLKNIKPRINTTH